MATKKTTTKRTSARSRGGGSGNGADTTDGGGNGTLELRGERELIVMARPEDRLHVSGTDVAAASAIDVSAMKSLLTEAKISMLPLFGDSEESVRAAVAQAQSASEQPLPDLSVYYRIEAPDEDLDDLAEQFMALETVQAAYVKPPAEPAVFMDVQTTEPAPPDVTLPVGAPAAATPDFTPRQGYLNPAPEGIDARYAWRLAGGRGRGVRCIDIEGGWRFSHEDLRANQGGVVLGSPSSNTGWENHGTAVMGEIGGDVNTLGITGICPDASTRAISIFGIGSAPAIRQAADLLSAGDLLLIELHAPGPRFNFQGRADQRGYIPMEFWPDNWDAICYAVARGVVVVEAAGNGAENLDDPLYDARPVGFPATWSNPFRRGARDSGAILVGAGAPPPGTHGRDHGPDRSRLGFSNYGAAVDAQGWGREVTTTGYGQLWRDASNPGNRDRWYTDTFSGTSSASPIIVGALGCVQGVLKARGQTPLSPQRARQLLRSTGSPQTDAPGRPRSQRIGSRPNLRQLIAAAFRQAPRIGVQFRGTVPANATRRWFTFRWPAQWHVQWSVVPTTPRRGGPQIEYSVQVERASHAHITYWISVKNLTPEEVQIEARYEVTGAT